MNKNHSFLQHRQYGLWFRTTPEHPAPTGYQHAKYHHVSPLSRCMGIGWMLVFLLLPCYAQAGALDSPAAPTAAGSAMFTITDIYNRLNTGATVTKRVGAFTEPAAAPTVGTGRTLDEVMTLVNSRAPVAKTGAKAIGGYTADANEDITLQRGVTRPVPRFTDNANGTVTDNLTGLIWLKNAQCATTTSVVWATALADVASLNSTGLMGGTDCVDTSNAGVHQTDWRLPSVKELSSLIDFANFTPALPTGHPFTVSTRAYWSGTTDASLTNFAWNVDINHGFVNSLRKTLGGAVWPVRGGQ